MSDWNETSIGNHIDLISGYAFKSGNFLENKVDGALPVIKIKNVANGDVNFNDVVYHKFDSSLEKFVLSKGDVLIAMTGNHPPAETQVVGDVSKYKLSEKALLNQRVGKLVPKGKTDLNFIYYLFKSEDVRFNLANKSSGSANQANISKGDILSLVVKIPSPDEQTAISDVLNSIDNKIDLLNLQNLTLEKMAQTLFRQWFVEEAKEEWEEVPLESFFDFLEGPGIRNWQYTETGTPFINIRLISNGDINVSKANYVSNEEANGKYSHFHLKEDDMIVSTSGTLGKNAIVRKYHLPLLLNTSVIRFRPKDKKNYSFMYQYLNSKLFQEHLESAASGSVQANFGPTHLKAMNIQKPSLEALEGYAVQADPLYFKLKSNQAQIRTLTVLRDTLIPSLMNNEVTINTN